MKPKSRKTLDQILKQIKETGSLEIIETLRSIDYEKPIVPPRQFLEDDYYLGKSVKHLSDTWKGVFDEVFSPDATVGTLILTGSIGCGKTTFASACFCRKIYELSCLKDPAQFHGLLTKSKIIFGIYNITIDKADDCAFLIEQFLRESPWFQENNPLRDRPRFPLAFPKKRIEIAVGSLGSHALGDNVLGFILDEMNFFKKIAQPDAASEKTRAHQLFNEARTRQVSRFMKSGRVPGLNILISSRKYQSSFLDEFIQKVKSDPDLAKTTKVVELALWQVKNPDDFSGESFDVLIGSEHYPSRVLEVDEIVPEGGKTITVPEEYREQFIIDPDLALRDIAGVSTSGTAAFFPVKSKILHCVDHGRSHPFTRPIISVPLMSGHTITEFFAERKLCKIVNSIWTPTIHPEAERHIHVDLAVTEECIGITMGHPYMMHDSRFGAYVDFMLRIKPPVRGELDLSSVVNFIRDLRDTYHFNIKKVTFDQYQSRMPIQLLLQAGFTAELLSVGLSHYVHLRTCFGERRVNMYEYGPLIEEIDGLQKDPQGGRPSHKSGPGNFDDVTDSLAGVVSRCYNVESSRVTKGDVKKGRVRLPGQETGMLVVGINSDHQQEEYRS